MNKYDDLLKTVYSSWLGKIIGIRLGAPVEGFTKKQIESAFSDIHGYVTDYGVFAADDDSNGPFFFSTALLHNLSLEITAEQLGWNVLNVLCREKGFFWWGGVGVSSEHTAYANLEKGIPAPLSGSKETNGIVMAEQIGGQIFSDCWGYISLGNPEIARDLAKKMSSVTHDGDGIEGGIFVAVAIALAFSIKDAKEITKKALTYCNSDSHYVMVANEIINYYYEHPENWQDCYKYIFEHHGYDKYPGTCHIIPNMALMIMALFYGENDFDKTLCLLNQAGWDTDCNCGNVGSIMGAMLSIDKIDPKWIEPINDVLVSSSAIGYLNNARISAIARYFTYLGCKLQNIECPELDMHSFVTDFSLPYATNGLVAHSHRFANARLTVMDEQLVAGIMLGNTDYILRVDKSSIYTKDTLYDARYEPSFCSLFYPGETFSFTLSNPNKLNVFVRLFVESVNGEKVTQNFVELKEETTIYSMKIPPLGSTVKTIGFEIQFKECVRGSYFIIHKMECDRKMEADIALNEVFDYGLNYGEKVWSTIGNLVTVDGTVELDDSGIILSGNPRGLVLASDYFASYKQLEFDIEGTDFEILTNAKGATIYQSLGIHDHQATIVNRKYFDKTILLQQYIEQSNHYHIILTEDNMIINDEIIPVHSDLCALIGVQVTNSKCKIERIHCIGK